jgi:hypothetical protein
VQHPETKSKKPDVDLSGAEPLAGSGFENEPAEPDFDADLPAESQPEEEDHQ